MARKKDIIEAFFAYLEGNIDKAIAIYEKLLKNSPKNFLVARNLALCYIAKKDLDKASFLIDRYLAYIKSEKIKDSSLLRDFLLLKLLIKFKNGDLDSAFNILKDFLGEDVFVCPIDLEETLNLDLNLEKILIKLDEDEWLKLHRWLNRSKRGELIEQLPEYLRKEIIEFLEDKYKSSKNDSEKSETLAYLAIMLASMGRVGKALELSEKALDIDENNFIANLVNGKILYLLGKLDKAYQSFQKASELDGGEFKHIPLLNMGIVLAKIGDFDNAIKLVNKAIKIKISSQIVWYVRAKILFEAERWKEAEKAFKALLNFSPKDPKIWINLGKIYLNLGKISEAIKAFNIAKKRIESDEELDILVGLAKEMK